MRLNKILAIAALTAIGVTAALAQTPTVNIIIRMAKLGPDYSSDDVTTLAPVPFATGQSAIGIAPTEFGSSPTFAVQVTLYVRLLNHNANIARGINLINTYIDLRGTGLTIYDGFDAANDEVGANDDRKNAHSHGFGQPQVDGAGNASDYLDNSARWFQRGGNVAGPLAAGKSTLTTPYTGTTPRPMYSFVVLVPNNIATYNINFARVLSGGAADTSVPLKTNAVGQPATGGGFYQYNLELEQGIIVVPEPASMIALGSGLVGLLALRRRRAN